MRDQRRRRRSWRQRKGGGGSRLQFCGLGPFVAEQALPRAQVEGKERVNEREAKGKGTFFLWHTQIFICLFREGNLHLLFGILLNFFGRNI